MKIHQIGSGNPIVEIGSDEFRAMIRKYLDDHDMFKDREMSIIQVANGKHLLSGLLELLVMVSNIPS
jgi:hypothetical protein